MVVGWFSLGIALLELGGDLLVKLLLSLALSLEILAGFPGRYADTAMFRFVRRSSKFDGPELIRSVILEYRVVASLKL